MKTNHQPKPQRRIYPEELKREAVQMLLDGHSAPSVAQNLGIRHTSLLYRWKAEFLGQEGRAASALEVRVRQLEEQLRRTERERERLPDAQLIMYPDSNHGAQYQHAEVFLKHAKLFLSA
jgi:transposase